MPSAPAPQILNGTVPQPTDTNARELYKLLDSLDAGKDAHKESAAAKAAAA